MYSGLRPRFLALVACLAAAPVGAADGPRHVPSPDWRDQVVYFVMLGRFANGDRGNDDQHADEYDPADGAKFSGGDLRGARERIPYIRELGATTVWITPPVANQWWNPRSHYGGYHGYWATDFSAIDAHFGTREDYRAFARALHGNGMYLVQDVVVNHMADFLGYDPAQWDANDPTKGLSFVRDTQGQGKPPRAPFDRNDPRDPKQREAAIWHWTPGILDFADDTQRLTYQLANLDDLDTGTPAVRRALRKAYGDWIEDVGVDAFRIDTVFHVPADFFADFLRSDDPQAPGILRIAEKTGRKDFHAFGEGFALDKPYDDTQAKRIDAYMRKADGTPLLPGMVDFPLYATTNEVFARGAPTAQLGWRLENRMRVHADPWRMATFVDNHDVERFLAGGDVAGLKQALLMQMTVPGIPVIWQGTEQGFREQRAAMFAGGYKSEGRDHFDTQSDLFRYVQRVIALRRGDKVFSRGTPKVLRANAAGPGVLAYTMTGEDGARRLVVFNTASHVALADNLDVGGALQPMFAIAGNAEVHRAGAGRVSLVLPPKSGFAWRIEAGAGADARAPGLSTLPKDTFDGDFEVQGSGDDVRIVIDDDLEHATSVSGRSWRTKIDTGAMVDPRVEHGVVAWNGTGASERRTFRVVRDWKSATAVDDPSGDDTGPNGRYAYPTDPGFAARQGDIERVDVSTSGGALRVAVRMRALTTPWNPPNGFDHLALSLFIDLPNVEGGARAMPQLNGDLPGDLRWDVRVRANGWSNAMFSAKGASATEEGTPITPGALLAVDAATRTITFTFPASSLGGATDLSGARVYATTWDYDAGWRALAPRAGPHAFGGGDPARDPRVLDAAGPILIP
jgi:glycosidase